MASMAFECLEVAFRAAAKIGPLADLIERRDRDLAEQLERAAASMVSNIDEGRAAIGRQRSNYFLHALGSAREVTTQLRLAEAWGYIAATTAPLDDLDRIRAMLWRLST
jgi:four helix bundle protein